MNRTSFVIAIALVMGSCGGSDSDGADAALTQAQDTSIKPLEREALTEVDMGALDMADLAVELPWTRNDVNRNPTPNAARALLEDVAVEQHDGFDRMIFTFGSGVAFPGYNIRVFDPGNAIVCGVVDAEGSPEAEDPSVEPPFVPEVAGDRFLVLNIHPARTSENGRSTMSVGTEMYEQQRVHEAGVACAEDDVVTWITGLAEGTDVRALELRSPNRLVVDVR